ncbi:hypothetical protein ACT80S_14320 [Ramlibacter sp. MAHUQ-53]|uniref:hypothetical protein n=1 Tax=unclassified Ramlibacter TaxID=2617605 RepID=UPI00363AEDEF
MPRTTRGKSGSFHAWVRRAGAGIAVLLFLLAGPGLSAARAGQERYDYDPLGRLVRHTDAAGLVTDYVYDPAGNILSVRRAGAGAQAPVLESVTPSVVRRGETRSLVLSGQRLLVGTLRAGDPGLVLSNLRQSATQLRTDLAVSAVVPLGPQALTFSSAQGTSSIPLTVGPSLPVLSVEPSPLALPPDNAPHSVALRLTAPDVVDHEITVASSDASRVSVPAARVTLPAGQTTALMQVVPRANGFATLTLTSALLAPASLPVFVTADFRGVNTSHARAVQVQVGPAGQAAQVAAAGTFTAPRVGLVRGPVLTRMAPQAMAVGSVATLTLEGQSLPPDLRVSVMPAAGLSVSAAPPASNRWELAVTSRADAATGPRRLVVTTAAGQPVPFADPNQAILLLTTGQPRIDSIEPLFAVPGQRVQLLVRGAHLQEGQLLLQPGVDLAVDAQPVRNADGRELIAQVQVDPLAQPGARTVQVATPSGTSDPAAASANQFTIVREVRQGISPIASPVVGVRFGSGDAGAGPTVASTWLASPVGVSLGAGAGRVLPATGVLGTSLVLEVSGAGLQAVTRAELRPGAGLALGTPQASADGTRLSLPLSVAADAPRTPSRLVLSTASGNLKFAVPGGDQFLVVAPAPALVAVKPQVVVAGQSASVHLRGVNFSDVQGVRIEPPGGLVPAPPFVASADGTELTFQLQVAAGAAPGERVVIVQAAGGESPAAPQPANTFQVATKAGPLRDAISAPPVGVRRGMVSAPASEPRAAHAPHVGVSFNLPVASVEEPRAARAAAVGVLVGTALTGMQPRSPAGFETGSSGVLTLTGVGLDRVTAARVAGPDGMTLGTPVASADGTSLSLPVRVAGSAPSGLYGIRVLSGTGTAAQGVTAVGRNDMLVSVGAPPTAIHSVEPIVLEPGKTYTFTVRGQGLKDVYEVLAEPAQGLRFGIAFTAPAWSATELGELLRVQLTVAADAPIGQRVIRLRTPGALTSHEPTPAVSVEVVSPQ